MSVTNQENVPTNMSTGQADGGIIPKSSFPLPRCVNQTSKRSHYNRCELLCLQDILEAVGSPAGEILFERIAI